MTKDEALKMAIEAMTLPNNLSFLMAITACKDALEQPAQKSMACDGKFPENFDDSLNIPAQYLRLANGIMMDYMGKRLWDVPMCATAIMEFINAHPAPSWQGLSDAEVLIICAKMAAKLPNKEIDLIFARAIEQVLKEKNNV